MIIRTHNEENKNEFLEYQWNENSKEDPEKDGFR